MSRWTSALAAIAIVATACGGGDDDAGGEPTTTTEAATTTTTEPTGDTTTSTTTSTTTTQPANAVLEELEAAGGVSIAVASSTSLIWMTTDATVCSPAGPDTANIRARVTTADDPVVGVTAVLRPAADDGEGDEPLATLELEPGADGWETTVGPFEARRSSQDRAVAVTVSATTESGRTFDARFGLDVRAPIRCENDGSSGSGSGDAGSGTTTTTAGPAASTTTTTTAAATTTSTTTTSTTTTTTIPVTASASASPAQVTASGGPCAEPGGVLTISVSTTGAVDRVGAQISLATGASQTVELGGGSGSWSTTVGPFPGSAGMPDSSTISVAVTVRPAAGPDVLTSTSATLLRPC